MNLANEVSIIRAKHVALSVCEGWLSFLIFQVYMFIALFIVIWFVHNTLHPITSQNNSGVASQVVFRSKSCPVLAICMKQKERWSHVAGESTTPLFKSEIQGVSVLCYVLEGP